MDSLRQPARGLRARSLPKVQAPILPNLHQEHCEGKRCALVLRILFFRGVLWLDRENRVAQAPSAETPSGAAENATNHATNGGPHDRNGRTNGSAQCDSAKSTASSPCGLHGTRSVLCTVNLSSGIADGIDGLFHGGEGDACGSVGADHPADANRAPSSGSRLGEFMESEGTSGTGTHTRPSTRS